MRALVVAAVLLASGSAGARERPREGLVVGVGLGAGAVGSQMGSGSGRETGVALEGRLGGMVHRRVALLASLSIVAGDDDAGNGWSQTILGAGARLFVTEVFWLEAAVGTASFASDPAIDVSGGIALLGAAGVDIINTKAFGVGLALHGALAGFDADDSTGASALAVTITWY